MPLSRRTENDGTSVISQAFLNGMNMYSEACKQEVENDHFAMFLAEQRTVRCT